MDVLALVVINVYLGTKFFAPENMEDTTHAEFDEELASSAHTQ